MKILIIDDNKAYRDIITHFIKQLKTREPIEIKECCNLEKALKQLKNNDYSVIILDLNLPKSNGLETVKIVIEYLKKIEKNIPIIVLTEVEDFAIGREAWKLGIKDFLIKDEIQPEDLARSLNFANYNNKNNEKKSILI